MSARHVAGASGNDWLRSVMTPAQLAASARWASRAGLILALAHVRLAGVRVGGVDVLQTSRGRLAIGAAHALALTVGCMAFIFFDAIHRIDQGQTPSNVFPTSLSAAMLYLPWLGSKLSGGYAGTIELSSALVALILCLACMQASVQRHHSAVTAVRVAAIFVTVVPAMLEGYVAPDSLTIEGGKPVEVGDEYALAMFCNR